MRKVLSAQKMVRGQPTVVLVKEYHTSHHDGNDNFNRFDDDDARDGEAVSSGEGQGRDGSNEESIEDFENMDDGFVPRIFEILTPFLSKQVRLQTS